MTRVALRGLLGRKLRAGLTAFAIVLGVAMVSGTFVLTDTIKAAFSTVFTAVYQNTDAVISGRSAISRSSNGNAQSPPSLPASLLGRVRALPEVASASGSISDTAQLVGRDGKVISSGGAPGLAFSYAPSGRRFSPLTLASGRFPREADQIDIDASTARKYGFRVGQRIGVVARGPVRRFQIVGTVEIGGVSSLGGATMTIFTLPEAQRLFDKVGRYDQISVAARHGYTSNRLVQAIRPLLGPSAQVRSGRAQARQATKDTSGFLNIFQDFLLAFGGIALFVGSFVIANTLSITVAQRTRELAILRTLGASRRQVLGSVLLEALLIGALASVIGLALGLLLAKGLNSLLASFGIDLPQTATVFKTRTVIVALAVGIVITLIAALRPALRATRVAPISLVREGSLLPPSRWSRYGTQAALGTILGAIALMLIGLFVSTLSTGLRLLGVGAGALALFIGVAMLAPQLVPPLARLLGWPATRVGGAPGQLAQGNSARNPARTASTASALMIGLALVTLVSVLAAGLRSGFESSVNSAFIANYAITAANNFSPISLASEQRAARIPGVTAVVGVRAGAGRAFGSNVNVTGVPPNASRAIRVDWAHGGPQIPAQLGSNGAFVSQAYARAQHLHVGSPLSLETPSGSHLQLKLIGITNPPKGASPYGDISISEATFDRAYQNPQNLFTFVNMSGGVTAANSARLTAALAGFPDAKVQDKTQFINNQLQGLTSLLNLLYVLLSLSVVVSLFGIVNTLVLTVFERTREIGMLRAIGMSRRQVRRMIRHESVITALLGATFGIPLGVLLAALIGATINFGTFTVPVGTLVVFVFLAVITGLIAAIWPARRAGKLNVLAALSYE